MKRNKYHINFFLLLICLSFSVDIHGLFHHDSSTDNEDRKTCELCIINLTEDNVDVGLIPSETHSSDKKISIVTHLDAPLASHEETFSKKLFKSDTLNKPPPYSIF